MPTIIDELTMTLSLDPAGFKEGAAEAGTSSDSLLAKVMATLQQIEQATKQTAANTAKTQEDAATKAAREAERAANAQEAAARRGARAAEEESKKAAEQMRAAGRQMEDAFDKVGSSIRRVGIDLLAMMGIAMSVTAMERMFMNISRTNAQMGILARSIDMNVTSLTTWTGAAERLGTTADAITAAFTKIGDAFFAMETMGDASMKAALQDFFQVSMYDEAGQRKSKEQILKEIHQSAWERHLSGRDIAGGLRAAGLPEELTPMMQEDPAETERKLAEQRRTGNTVGWFEAENSKKMLNDFKLLTDYVEGFAKQLVETLAPAIDGVVKRMIAWLQVSSNRDWLSAAIIEWATKLARAIVNLAIDLDNFLRSQRFKDIVRDVTLVANAADSAAQAIGGWGRVLEIFAGFWIAGKAASMIRTMREFYGVARALTLLPVTGALARMFGGAAGGAAAGAAGGAAAGAAGTAAGAAVVGSGVALGVAGGLAAIGVGLGTYQAMAARERQHEMEKLGYKPTMFDPNAGMVQQYEKDGKYYGLDDEKRILSEHFAAVELQKKANDLQKEAAEQQKQAADSLKEAADALTEAAIVPGSPEDIAKRQQDVRQSYARTAAEHGGGTVAPVSETSLPGKATADYGTRANNPGNLNYAGQEGATGTFAYTDPQTGAPHQMAVFGTMEQGIAAMVRQLQRNQERYGMTLAGALHGYAENDYTGDLGIDPNARLDIKQMDPAVLADLLSKQLSHEGRAISSGAVTRDMIVTGILQARGESTKGGTSTPGAVTPAPWLPWGSGVVRPPTPATASAGAAPQADAPKQPGAGAGAPTAPAQAPTWLPWHIAASAASTAPTTPRVPVAALSSPAAPPTVTLGAAAAGQRSQVAMNSINRSQSSETHIGEIHVHTAATDAPGIARAIKGELRRYDYATQADTGLA